MVKINFNGENVLHLEITEVFHNFHILKYTDQNSKPLEIQDKININLVIN